MVSEVAPGGARLLPGATFADVVSWPFFFYFRDGKLILDVLELEHHVFEALGGLLGLVGTTLSSSLYLFPLPLSFCKLGLSMTMKS